MPLLALPLALIGLVALPALAAIYVLRTRYRRRAVSSLMLWNAAALATGGGRKANRLQTPWVLLLELLALLLLVLAATMPRWLAAGQRARVMVVLDNSWSMRATDADGRSARDRGADALAHELDALGRYAAGFVLAGPKPQRLGDSARDAAGVAAVLERWTAEAPAADLTAAVALARETGGQGARVVVVTDRAREAETADGQTGTGPRWRAVGVAGDNAAVVRAVRRPGDAGGDAVMVEVARSAGGGGTAGETGAAGRARTVGVQIEALEPGANPTQGFNDDAAWAIVARQRVALGPGQSRRVWLDGSDNTAGRVLRVTVTMPGDVLAADDRAWLAAADARPVGVAVQVQDPALSAAVAAALRATGRTTPAPPGEAELRVVDDTVAPAGADAPPVARRATGGGWVMRFLRPADAAGSQAFLGPFLLDDAHPLTADAALAGVVWSAAADPAVTGPWMRGADAVPASAGDVPLIGWFGGAAAEIRVNLDAQRSTVLNNVAFPVLMSNAVRARAAARPGVAPVNLPLGAVVALRAGAGNDAAGVTSRPTATVRRVAGLGATGDDPPAAPPIALQDGAAVWAPPRAGVYRVALPGAQDQTVVVHGQSAAESDLSAAQTADSGDLHADLLSRPEYRGLGWLLGLAALALLGAEAWLLRPGAGVGAARPGAEAAA